MKKIMCAVLTLCLTLSLAACAKDTKDPKTASTADTSKDQSSAATVSTESFVKPYDYASMLIITLDPQFKLYMDENEKVLALEAVNDDAKSIKNSIEFEDQKLSAVVKNIVTVSQKNGFLKKDTKVTLEVPEAKATDEVKTDLLSKAKQAVSDTAKELKTDVKVQAIAIIPNEVITDPNDQTQDDIEQPEK